MFCENFEPLSNLLGGWWMMMMMMMKLVPGILSEINASAISSLFDLHGGDTVRYHTTPKE
jgi:hypothetical protein